MTEFCFDELVGQKYRRRAPYRQTIETGVIEKLDVRPDHIDGSVDLTITFKRVQLTGRIWKRVRGWIRQRTTPGQIQITVDLGTCSMQVGKRRVRFQAGDGEVVFVRLPQHS